MVKFSELATFCIKTVRISVTLAPRKKTNPILAQGPAISKITKIKKAIFRSTVDATNTVWIFNLYFDVANCGSYLMMHRRIVCFQTVLWCAKRRLISDNSSSYESRARLNIVHRQNRENYAPKLAE